MDVAATIDLTALDSATRRELIDLLHLFEYFPLSGTIFKGQFFENKDKFKTFTLTRLRAVGLSELDLNDPAALKELSDQLTIIEKTTVEKSSAKTELDESLLPKPEDSTTPTESALQKSLRQYREQADRLAKLNQQQLVQSIRDEVVAHLNAQPPVDIQSVQKLNSDVSRVEVERVISKALLYAHTPDELTYHIYKGLAAEKSLSQNLKEGITSFQVELADRLHEEAPAIQIYQQKLNNIRDVIIEFNPPSEARSLIEEVLSAPETKLSPAQVIQIADKLINHNFATAITTPDKFIAPEVITEIISSINPEAVVLPQAILEDVRNVLVLDHFVTIETPLAQAMHLDVAHKLMIHDATTYIQYIGSFSNSPVPAITEVRQVFWVEAATYQAPYTFSPQTGDFSAPLPPSVIQFHNPLSMVDTARQINVLTGGAPLSRLQFIDTLVPGFSNTLTSLTTKFPGLSGVFSKLGLGNLVPGLSSAATAAGTQAGAAASGLAASTATAATGLTAAAMPEIAATAVIAIFIIIVVAFVYRSQVVSFSAQNRAQYIPIGGQGGGGENAGSTYDGPLISVALNGEKCFPLDHGGVHGGYLPEFHPSVSGNQSAIDLNAPIGTQLTTPISGTVLFAGWNTQGYGNLVILAVSLKDVSGSMHNCQMYFGHMSQVLIPTGTSTITKGTVVGLLGSTGNSTGPHVHWGVTCSDGKINIRDLFPTPDRNIQQGGNISTQCSN